MEIYSTVATYFFFTGFMCKSSHISLFGINQAESQIQHERGIPSRQNPKDNERLAKRLSRSFWVEPCFIRERSQDPKSFQKQPTTTKERREADRIALVQLTASTTFDCPRVQRKTKNLNDLARPHTAAQLKGEPRIGGRPRWWIRLYITSFKGCRNDVVVWYSVW